MKIIGMIGGLSWYSTSVYYKLINQFTNERLGGSHSAKILLYSVDFDEFKTLQEKNDWEGVERMLTSIALKLQNGGVDFLILATNTPHLVADIVRQKIKIPLLHIAEETAKEINKFKIKKVGLIGTKFTMENSFFKDKVSAFGIETDVPDSSQREFIHWSIFNELTKGVFLEETKQKYLSIIDGLKSQGSEGVIFGCTEISLLLKREDCSVRIFDTTLIHSKSAVDFSLD